MNKIYLDMKPKHYVVFANSKITKEYIKDFFHWMGLRIKQSSPLKVYFIKNKMNSDVLCDFVNKAKADGVDLGIYYSFGE